MKTYGDSRANIAMEALKLSGEAMIWHREDRILFANNSAGQLLGYSAEELTGSKLDEINLSPVARGCRDSRSGTVEWIGRHRDGTTFPLTIRWTTHDCDGEQIICTTFHRTDANRISAELQQVRKQLANTQEELRLRRFAVDVAAEAMFTLRPDGHLLEVNQTACDRLGYTRDELLKMNVSQVYASSSSDTFADHVAMLRRDAIRVIPTRHRRKDGTLLDVEVSARLFEYEGHEYICATARDVSDLKLAEEKQRDLHQQLAHMNRLSSMGEMASTIAHELNQPLCVISSFASLLQYTAETESFDTSVAKEITETIGSQAVLAGDIVRRMRGFCLNKPPTRVSVNLRELVDESISLLDPELRHAAVTVRVQINVISEILVDRIQIQQVLVNLVHNAIEAMEDVPRKDRVLRVYAEQTSANAVRLTVADCGEGIPECRRAMVFQPFASTKADGMGMGLAISRSIIEAHNGKLVLDDAIMRGTMFHIDLPLMQQTRVSA